MKMKIEILSILSQISDYLMPDGALFNEVSLSFRPSPTQTEYNAAMGQLEGDGYVMGITNELTNKRRWKITERGRLALAEAKS